MGVPQMSFCPGRGLTLGLRIDVAVRRCRVDDRRASEPAFSVGPQDHTSPAELPNDQLSRADLVIDVLSAERCDLAELSNRVAQLPIDGLDRAIIAQSNAISSATSSTRRRFDRGEQFGCQGNADQRRTSGVSDLRRYFGFGHATSCKTTGQQGLLLPVRRLLLL
jgi:hypothetical protein